MCQLQTYVPVVPNRSRLSNPKGVSKNGCSVANATAPIKQGVRPSLKFEMSDKVCPHCNRPLMEIDHYGEVGCIDCNRWGHPGDDKLIMELMDSDLEALRGSGGESG